MVQYLLMIIAALVLRLVMVGGLTGQILASGKMPPPIGGFPQFECFRGRARSFERRRSTMRLSSTPSDVPDCGQMRRELKRELVELSRQSSRGFEASAQQRARAKEILEQLRRLNPSPEPTRDYYNPESRGTNRTSLPSLCGKWTLLYTDAPDIVGLAAPNVLADLGRIGQHCDPPFIKNVIEWKRPGWATDLPSALLPFGGRDSSPGMLLPSRILQKVVTKARASPDEPLRVKLDAAGLQLSFDEEAKGASEPRDERQSTLRGRGLLGAYLPNLILDLQGPLSVPFGEFQVLYLDDDFRATRTFQGYVAVNERIKPDGDAWF